MKTNPFVIVDGWLNKERTLGSNRPARVVLATKGLDGVPRSRIVAATEISDKGIYFVTSAHSRKHHEIQADSRASMVLWLPLQQREVKFEGVIHQLDGKTLNTRWKNFDREFQLRIATMCPHSGQEIESQDELQQNYLATEQKFINQEILINDSVIGYRFIPTYMLFYTLGENTFPSVEKYVLKDEQWVHSLQSP